ncbi:MAG TPA: hypothetical protein PKJ94_00745 [Ferruginibacter sp.]|nr:hypothetical protein [Ferruginibacter sp.]
MRKFLLLNAVLFSLTARAQTDSLKWVKEINEQVWKPFITHLVSGNKTAFSAVHSKRITRVEIDRGVLLDFEKYFPPADTTSSIKKKKPDWVFELRFDKRISNGVKAWESGYYKGTVKEEGKNTRSYYGRFFVVLEKENGTWKILVDADTGKDANEENFSKAFAMEPKQ